MNLSFLLSNINLINFEFHDFLILIRLIFYFQIILKH